MIDAALRARATGDHAAAITLWRALLQRTPDDWRLALELKHDLRAAGRYPESDPMFRAAARHLPDTEWLAHYGALYAFHADDLPAIESRARQWLATRPGDPRILALLGDVAAQRRDWQASQTAFAEAYAADPRDEFRFKRDTAALYRRLAPFLSAAPGIQYAIAFLTLDRNPERETELRRQFAACSPKLIRQPGLEGSRLTTPAVRRLGADPAMRGTLGCFLSHAASWESMLARRDEACLFIEDDTIPLLDLPPTLAPFDLPPEFDLIFVNAGLSPRLDPAAATRFTLHPLPAAMRAFAPEANAPGGDGYLLSRAGARKLLAWVEADGFSDDVDWRLIAYGLTAADIASLPRPSHAAPWLERIARVIGRPDRLSAYVLHPPLITSVGVSSDREDENRRHPAEPAPKAEPAA